MIVYPAIDILRGQAVRLRQGRAEDVTVYGAPLEMARRWAAGGATHLHVVDLEGAFDGAPRNHSVVAEIVRRFPQLKVQLGGGIRSMDDARAVIDAGGDKVSLNSAALSNPGLITELAKIYGSQAVIGMGRSTCTMGSAMVATSRFQPIMRPRGMPTTMAKAKP